MVHGKALTLDGNFSLLVLGPITKLNLAWYWDKNKQPFPNDLFKITGIIFAKQIQQQQHVLNFSGNLYLGKKLIKKGI